MSSGWDAGNSEAILEGSASGYAEIRKPLPTPPANCSSLLLIFRGWYENYADDSYVSIGAPGTYVPVQHWGLCFDSTVLDAGGSSTDYTNFTGVRAYTINSVTRGMINTYDAAGAPKHGYAILNSTAYNMVNRFNKGNGNNIALFNININGHDATHSKENGEMVATFPGNKTLGETVTYCWWIKGSKVDQRVTFQAWVNDQSFNLDTLNINDPLLMSNPKGVIPVSNNWGTGELEINSNLQTGSNWRPSSGVFGVPHSFIARYAMDSLYMKFKKIGVVYGV